MKSVDVSKADIKCYDVEVKWTCCRVDKSVPSLASSSELCETCKMFICCMPRIPH